MASRRPFSHNAGTEHKDIHSLAINNTLFHRLSTRLALQTLGRFHRSDGLCTPISKRQIVKTGRRVQLTEAVTMRFVAEHTSVPVPKVYCSFVHKDRTFIYLQHQYAPDCIYNMDDSGFAVGESQSSRALVNIRDKSSWKVVSGRQEWITAIECISASGRAIPPLTSPWWEDW